MLHEVAIKIAAWNINGLKNKCNDLDFIRIVKKYDIVIVSETWLSENSNLNIDGEYIFCKPAYKKAKKGRHSGGFIIIVKKHLRKGVKFIDDEDNFCLWFKLEKTFFNLNADIFVSAIYIPPRNCVYSDVKYFDILEDKIAKYSNLGEIILMGDMNSRVGESLDFIKNDCDNF